jgi:aspartate aminotransferase-like enzyme
MATFPLPNGPDPNGHQEFSVVYTDRALNHMSAKFQATMNSLSKTFKETYNGEQVALIPGSGSYAMEAVARQFTTKEGKTMVLRNGWFSYRWTQIFDECWPDYKALEVCKARPIADEAGQTKAYFEPQPIAELVAQIREYKPQAFFMPQVETSAGMILPEDYIKQIAAAVHEGGGMVVLDSIAAGCIWVDIKALGVDVLITAPQKGWSGPACAGVVVLGEKAVAALETTKSSSFILNLKTWVNIMKAYEGGGHAYHATMPTDALVQTEEAIKDMKAFGMDKCKEAQQELGDKIRATLASKGLKSLAAPGFAAPGVVVVYTDDATIGGKFAKAGVQIAAGVPLMCDNESNSQSDKFRTFRLGLFGLDKLQNVDACVANLDAALSKVL